MQPRESLEKALSHMPFHLQEHRTLIARTDFTALMDWLRLASGVQLVSQACMQGS